MRRSSNPLFAAFEVGAEPIYTVRATRRHDARLAASRADWTAGRSSAIRIAMIAITTRSSISVNAETRGRR